VLTFHIRSKQRRRTIMNTLSTQGALSVSQFCEWASIGRTKFYQEVKEGRLVIRKIGNKTIVTMKDANFWLSNLPIAP